jgi:Ca2+-binding EF-hand superfamily protein
MGNVCATDKATATMDASDAKPEEKKTVAPTTEESSTEKVAEPEAKKVDESTEEKAEEEVEEKAEEKEEGKPEEKEEEKAEEKEEEKAEEKEEEKEEAEVKEGDTLDEKDSIDAVIVLQLLKGDDAEFQAIIDNLDNKETLLKWWNELDFNNNGIVSLAEIQKWVQEKGWEVKAPALMQAYKYTTSKGDDFVQKREFPKLCRGIVYMNRLWDLFDDIDTSDDRRVSLDEFKAAFVKLGYPLTHAAAEEAFDSMDKNDGGVVLFGEFGRYVVKLAHPSEVEFDEEEEEQKKEEEEKKEEEAEPEAEAEAEAEADASEEKNEE